MNDAPALSKSVKIPDDVWEAAKIRAIHEGVTLQQVVEEALREYLAKPAKKDKAK